MTVSRGEKEEEEEEDEEKEEEEEEKKEAQEEEERATDWALHFPAWCGLQARSASFSFPGCASEEQDKWVVYSTENKPGSFSSSPNVSYFPP